MSKRSNTHNRFAAAELDSAPSQLDELPVHLRIEKRQRRSAGWRRNLSVASLLMVALAVTMYIAR